MTCPDLILHNAVIATCDRHDTVASALAVTGAHVSACGADHDVLHLAGPGTRVANLGGRFVCPGFADCHVHLTSWALLAGGRQVNLEGSRSLAEALERTRVAAARVPEGKWLRGRGWDRNHWPEDRFPTAADLDLVTGQTPCVLPSHDGHSVWANSAAMRKAGLDPTAPDPAGGRILRDATGRPSGVFQEAAAAPLWACVPPPGREETTEALRDALPVAASLGLVRVHNCEARDSMQAAAALRDSGELTLRVVRFHPAGAPGSEEGPPGGDEWLRTVGFKAFLDGALGSQTAAMLKPYEGSENSGVLMMDPEELRDLVFTSTERGYALALHAIGDRAIRLALDAFEAVTAHFPPERIPSHRIEHAQHFHPDDILRCGRLGMRCSVQPAHMLADIATCERHVGARSEFAFPLRSLLDAGAKLLMGSDAPVEVIDPLIGFRCALARQSHAGTPAEGWFPQERLTALQALRGYTCEPARAAPLDAGDLEGGLGPGRLADLVVLSHDLLTASLDEIRDARVLATMVGGRTVFDPQGAVS